jgi:lambda repressor-like predicted transcriptional regulator
MKAFTVIESKRNPRRVSSPSPREFMIRSMMLAKGISVSNLAAMIGANLSALSEVISGKLRNGRIENGIARILGVGRKNLWRS